MEIIIPCIIVDTLTAILPFPSIGTTVFMILHTHMYLPVKSTLYDASFANFEEVSLLRAYISPFITKMVQEP